MGSIREPAERRDDSLLMHRVAAMHFRERLSNLEIARALGISRFRVARLLDNSLTTGLVDVRIDLPSPIDEELSSRLGRLTSGDAKVLAEGTDAPAGLAGVSALALRHLAGILTDGDRLAIAWGRTLDAIATTGSHLQLRLPRADIVQLVGGIPSTTGGLEASDLVRRFAALTGGRSIVLNAPLVVPTRDVARGLRGERSVSETFDLAASANVALFGVGAWVSGPSHLHDLMSEADRAAMVELDVAADACGILVSSTGRILDGDLPDRIVGIEPAALRKIPRRVAVVRGPDKAAALRALLRAELVTDLILDGTAARELLELEDGPDQVTARPAAPRAARTPR